LVIKRSILHNLNFKKISAGSLYKHLEVLYPTDEQLLKQYCSNGYEVFHLNGTCHFPMLEIPRELNKKIEQAINEVLVAK